MSEVKGYVRTSDGRYTEEAVRNIQSWGYQNLRDDEKPLSEFPCPEFVSPTTALGELKRREMLAVDGEVNNRDCQGPALQHVQELKEWISKQQLAGLESLGSGHGGKR